MRIPAVVCISLLIFQILYLPAQAKPLSQTTENQISQLIKTKLPNATVGLVIQDMISGEFIYDLNGHKLFTPASTSKMFTSVGALFELGPEYTFKTYLKSKIPLTKSTHLNTPLVLELSGDPTLKHSDIKQLFKSLSDNNVGEVAGDILIDSTRFSGPSHGQGWVWNAMTWYYSPPVTAGIVNENTVNIQITPNKELGKPAKIALLGEDKKYFLIQKSDVQTVTLDESESTCQINIQMNQHNEVYASGCWPISDKPSNLSLAVQDPNFYIKQLIKESLKEEKIVHLGEIRLATKADIQDTKHIIAQHESKPLSQLLHNILEDSNNLYTEAVFKTLGMAVHGTGSFQTGSLTLQRILKEQASINEEQMILVDGSGLSRYNLVSPHQLTRLLYVIHHHPTLSLYLKDALAVSGLKGTLKRRMQSFDLNERFLGKTGTMSHISSLSGYIERDSNKHPLAVTIMINGALQESAILKQLEDDIFRLITSDKLIS